MPELEPKKRPNPMAVALQLRGFPKGVSTLVRCPQRHEGFPLPPGAVPEKCVCCRADVVVPELARQLQLTPTCFPCLHGALADAKKLAAGGVQ